METKPFTKKILFLLFMGLGISSCDLNNLKDSLGFENDESADVSVALLPILEEESINEDSFNSNFLENNYSSSDYSAEITLDNYTEIVNSTYKHNAYHEITLFLKDSIKDEYESIQGDFLYTTKIYNCPVSGVITNIITTSVDYRLSNYNTENCQDENGNVDVSYKNENGYLTYQYSGKTDDNKIVNVEYADGKNNLDDETYYYLEGLGSLLVKGDLGSPVFFGANKTYLKTSMLSVGPIDSKTACYEQSSRVYELNGSDPFTEVIAVEDKCLVNPDYYINDVWSEVGSTKVYQMEILEDNTSFESIFYSIESRYELTVGIFEENGLIILESNNRYVDLINKSYNLSAGIYYIHLTHHPKMENRNGFEFQIKSDNTILNYAYELYLPSNLVSIVNGSWASGGGKSYDIDVSGNMIYQLEVIQKSQFSFKLTTDVFSELYLIDMNESLIDSDSGYDYIPSFINEVLDVGTYYLIAATDDEGVSGDFELIVNSGAANTASLNLYEN